MGSCSPLTIFESIDTCNQADANFQWLIPGGDTLFGRNITATISAPGVHDLIIQAFSSEGCVSDTLISDVYEVYGNPTADFVGYEENASNLRQEIRFTNVSSNAAHFEWSIDGTAIDQSVHLEYDFEAMAPGTYNICLLAKSVEGCENFTCHNIDLIVEQVVFAPSAFTPNNDGTNDGFKPVINGFSPEIYEFIVADRWGNIIFKSTNPDEYWMGEVDNGDYYSQNGVYNWMLKAKKFDTVEFEVYRGSVIMIR
jgi:gliding motility-associated-like protein